MSLMGKADHFLKIFHILYTLSHIHYVRAHIWPLDKVRYTTGNGSFGKAALTLSHFWPLEGWGSVKSFFPHWNSRACILDPTGRAYFYPISHFVVLSLMVAETYSIYLYPLLFEVTGNLVMKIVILPCAISVLHTLLSLEQCHLNWPHNSLPMN